LSVKEQRVDGSWSIKSESKLLRCTLMDFERNYLINNPSKQFNRHFSNLNTLPKLNPWFITGLIDAEGSLPSGPSDVFQFIKIKNYLRIS
jgi:hypothetical protein